MALKLSDFKEGEIKETVKQEPETGVGTFVKGIGKGVLKSFGEAGLGAVELGRKAQRGIAGAIGKEDWLGGGSFADKEQAQSLREGVLKANAPGEGTGKFIGTALQYLAPTSSVTKGQRILGGLASMAPKGLQTIGKATARFIPEAIGTGAVSALRSGGDVEQAKDEGVMAGAFSVGLGALGGLARATYWPVLEDSVNKALGTQGKKGGGVALRETAQKVSGLKVLKDRADDLTVTLDDGTASKFIPDNASYNTTLQAWDNARKKIYTEYTDLARKAGEKAVVDLDDIRTQITNALDAPVLSSEKNAVRSLLNDFDELFKDPKNVDVEQAQRFVQSLNDNTVQGFFAKTSDAASSKVYAGASKLIREKLDDLITESEGVGYQNLRSQYSALKSLENDLVRKFQQDARSIGGGLPEYMGGFAGADLISSALTADVGGVLRGATLGTFATLKRKLSNPERFLRRSFDLIDDTPSDLSSRLFGGQQAMSATERQSAEKLAESFENPSVGMSIRKTVTPESVAKRADEADMGVLDYMIRDYDNAILDSVTNRTLNDMGLGKATREERIRFAKEVLDEYAGVGGKVTIKADPLMAEAKGKSLEEFVKAQGQVLYHGGAKIDEVGSMRSRWKAFYMSDDPTYAKSYGGSKSVLNEIVLSPDAELADLRKPTDELISQLDQMTRGRTTGKTFNIQKPDGTYIGVPEVLDAPNFGSYTQEQVIEGIKQGKAHFAEEPAIKEALKKLGYDGMITQESKYGANYGVWNKNVLKTRSQLTDIWKEANRKASGDGK